MSLRETAGLAAAALTANALLGSCALMPKSDLAFDSELTGNFTEGYCWRDTNGWAVDIENGKAPTGDREFDVSTVVIVGQETKPDGNSIPVAGVTLHKIGNYSFRLVTSEDEPTEAIEVDLEEETFSRVLAGEPGKYDIVLSARKADDGRSYFRLDCLPDFDFIGDEEVKRLAEPTPLPSSEPTPSPTPSPSTTI